MAEVERKFLLAAMPPAEILPEGEEILQGYLLTKDGELRIRRRGGRSFLTVKGDGTISRDEWETEVPEWVFETLWPATAGRRVEKTRYSIDHEGLILEVDEYRGWFEGLLVTLECEFSDEEAANGFVLPSWAASAVDVTADKRFKNKNLAVNGLPRKEV